jgi:hypothetical protein
MEERNTIVILYIFNVLKLLYFVVLIGPNMMVSNHFYYRALF